MQQRHIDNGYGIFLIWLNWVFSVGAITATIVLSLWVSALYMPFVVFGLEFIIFLLIKRNRKSRIPVCFLIPFVASKALFWSAAAMVAINVIYSRLFVSLFFDPGTINQEIPFITQLIITPATAIFSLWAFRKGGNLSFCRDCKIRYGNPIERGFLGKLFSQEGQYQLRCLLIVASASAILAWTYYFVSYININLNEADKFFFVWNTLFVYIATVIFMGIRYIGLWNFYSHNLTEFGTPYGYASTKLRYILIHDDHICLQSPEDTTKSKIDTPVTVQLEYRRDVSSNESRYNFENLSQIKGVDIQFMYSTISTNADCSILHYLCYLSDEQKQTFDQRFANCRWYTFNEIASLQSSKNLSPLMSAEMHRLHTIAMSFKTYTTEGLRRYNIKNYRPTFRIKDIKSLDVDFNDSSWLFVADNNEDIPFFRFRKFWRKYINGIDD